MPRAIVVGAGVAGLGSALTLSRAGWDVELIERDATPMPPDATSAFSWDRAGAPQVRHSHAFLARLRNLLRDRYPDVLAELLAAGATELRFCDMLPADMVDREPRDGDDDLVALACRRTTFEWVLRRAVLASDHVTLIDGVIVEGLLAAPAVTGAPTVTGVRTDAGDRAADVVVLANGRRSAIPAWLAAIGVEVPEVEEDTGIVYLSRFYRLADGLGPPDASGPIGGDLGYLKLGVFQSDDRTFSITFAVRTDDRELRRLLTDDDLFDLAATQCAPVLPWIERAGERLTSVQLMAGLLNRQRRFLDDAGAPTVLGLHVVGDAHTASNPLYGRGCSLAMVMADELATALRDVAGDATAAATAYEAAVAREVEPWYRASITADRQSRSFAAWEAAHRDDPDADPADDPDASMVALLRDGMMPAVRTDPHVFRTFIRTFNLLVAPETVMTDGAVLAAVMTCYQERDQRPPDPPMGPRRAALLEVLASA